MGRKDSEWAHLVWPKLQGHHFGQHVHGPLGGTYEEGQHQWSLGWLQAGVGWARLYCSLTVDGVVSECSLGGLAGHVHDGPWGSASDQAPGHDLELQREHEAGLVSPTRSHSCPEGSSPGTPG